MGRKLKPEEDMYDLDDWDGAAGDDESIASEELIVKNHDQRTARQQLEDYFEMKALRQSLGEDPLEESFNL